MNAALTTIGIVCITSAIVGGGMKAAGVEVPVIASRVRQVALGIVGAGILVVPLVITLTKPADRPSGGSVQTGRASTTISSTSAFGRTAPAAGVTSTTGFGP